MTAEETERLLGVARKPGGDLRDRIRALQELGSTHDQKLGSRLRQLWDRPRASEPKVIDWDPEAAERVVDLYLILTLHQVGDDSLLSQIAPLVARSGDVLDGPDSEPNAAARVLGGIASLGPLRQVVQLADKPASVRNVVRTLQLLNLPSPPTGGPVTAFPQFLEKISFTISRFAEDLKTIQQLGNGRIVLSPGVEVMASGGDYDRGQVERTGTTLEVILTQELDMLGVTYFVTGQGATICTFEEAGNRWRQQWAELESRLTGVGWRR
jgi:hypothetical protein